MCQTGSWKRAFLTTAVRVMCHRPSMRMHFSTFVALLRGRNRDEWVSRFNTLVDDRLEQVVFAKPAGFWQAPKVSIKCCFDGASTSIAFSPDMPHVKGTVV